jgi:hypothetical protein
MVELHEASACTIRQARPFPTANRDSIVKKGGRSMFGLRRLAVLACADFCFTASYDFRRQSNKPILELEFFCRPTAVFASKTASKTSKLLDHQREGYASLGWLSMRSSITSQVSDIGHDITWPTQ